MSEFEHSWHAAREPDWATYGRRITIGIAGFCWNSFAAFSTASRSSVASTSPSLIAFLTAG
jgi:hypothetical protein